ncbi:MAG: hypothetical protein CBC09_02340 [Cellvibrionales bacterium TMED49]|nr:MAG: hypothetical protein CBC09_02340 [Cellvibrionales bacterium TMED49]
MKIIADIDIPDLDFLFGSDDDLQCMSGREITPDLVRDADVLLVRSITKVDKRLLEGSNIKFVGSATAGIDHIDVNYLRIRGINFSYAPGCNANAVVQYVLSVFCRLRANWRGLSVGIIGCGNIGGRLYRTLKALKVKTSVYDPFLKESLIPDLNSFEETLGCDIISLHTPFTNDGNYPTSGLINEKVIRILASGSLLINTGRGGIIDSHPLLDRLRKKNDISVALDVWDSEPNISVALAEKADIATGHIAGNSYEGKRRAAAMLRRSYIKWRSDDSLESHVIKHTPQAIHIKNMRDPINAIILSAYDVLEDDLEFRMAVLGDKNVGNAFDRYRKNYRTRYEFSHYLVSPSSETDAYLEALGFPKTKLMSTKPL